MHTEDKQHMMYKLCHTYTHGRKERERARTRARAREREPESELERQSAPGRKRFTEREIYRERESWGALEKERHGEIHGNETQRYRVMRRNIVEHTCLALNAHK